MFDALIVQPIFNLLVFIYAILPGHNFGLAIIVFTVVVRWLMWPLVKKQMHQTKVMRELQPELKKIKQAAKGDRQREQLLMMELYKERGINPFAPIGTLIVQFVILIGLYSGLRRVVENPQNLIDFTYGWLRGLPSLEQLAADISRFDNSLFGWVDLSRPAIGPDGVWYLPALLLVLASAAVQYVQSVQLMPKDEDARSLRQILREAGSGKQADAAETNAAVSRSMRYFIPALIVFLTIRLASALSLYWFVSGLIAYLQQSRALKQDEVELEAIVAKPGPSRKTAGRTTEVIEGEVVEPKTKPAAAKKKAGAKAAKKRSKKR